ncbi:MAG: ABC transporter ATP-binding protein [Gemmatimonadota bacterium]
MPPPILELSGIRKRFGSAEALNGVDFSLARGEVHALLGENGAGKSTLMHIAYGMLTPDAGSIRVGGSGVRFRSPRQAIALGIGMVHQHFTTVGPMTVEENLWLAAGRRAPWTAGRVAGLERLYEGISPTARVEELSVAVKQRLEIVKALAADARVLLLDEPTAVLAPPEVDDLLTVLRIFAEQGGAVALITHKLREVFAAADRVTVLRQGAVTLRGLRQDLTEEGLARAMIGADPLERVVGDEPPRRGRSGSADEPGILVRGPGFAIRGGEVVGLAAVEGNGQRAWLRVIAGVEPGSGVKVTGPVAFIPEDRTTEGLIPAFSLTENVALGLRDDPRWARGPWLYWPAVSSRTAELIAGFDIRASGPDAPASSLSGGNQQKLVFARALELRPRVLVAENPTRGLDVHATAEVHRRLRETAREGSAVVLYSADLDEVLTLADRVFVMYRGVVQEARAGASRDEIGRMMLGLFGDSTG